MGWRGVYVTGWRYYVQGGSVIVRQKCITSWGRSAIANRHPHPLPTRALLPLKPFPDAQLTDGQFIDVQLPDSRTVHEQTADSDHTKSDGSDGQRPDCQCPERLRPHGECPNADGPEFNRLQEFGRCLCLHGDRESNAHCASQASRLLMEEESAFQESGPIVSSSCIFSPSLRVPP